MKKMIKAEIKKQEKMLAVAESIGDSLKARVIENRISKMQNALEREYEMDRWEA